VNPLDVRVDFDATQASRDPNVARLAITSFGHIARIHRKLELKTVLPLLERLHNNPQLAGRVEDALADIRMYIPSKQS
jgi:hypothetical protein